MADVFFHVGFPKSASTTLQKSLFSKHSQILNLGLFPTQNIGLDTNAIQESTPYLNDDKLQSFYRNIVRLNEVHYGRCDNHLNFEHVCAEYFSSEAQKIVLSHEGFTSVFFANNDYALKARRLHQLLPNLKIIFIVRNQYAWLQSQYRDHPFDPRDFLKGQPMSFDLWFETILNYDSSIRLIDNLNYERVVSYYSKLFGKENVTVLQFESLVKTVEHFAKGVSNAMEIDYAETLALLTGSHENKGVSNIYNYYRQLKRQYFQALLQRNKTLKYLDKTIEANLKGVKYKKKYSLSNENVEKLRVLYNHGNAILCKKFNLVDTYFEIK